MSEEERLGCRYYRKTTDEGVCIVEIYAPDRKLPIGEDADDLIAFFNLIIRQIERSRDKAAAATLVDSTPQPTTPG